MVTSQTTRPSGGNRPLLGLRRKPGRLAIVFFRLPLKAYEHNAGPAVGRTFVAFTHVGRKTGQPYETVAMVLRDDAATGEAVICAAWGPQPIGTATCWHTPLSRSSWAASLLPHSSGSFPTARRSTSPCSSAASTRTVCGSSPPSSAGVT